MRVIVGLGNPGRRYARTRHNAGVRVVDRLLERLDASGPRPMFGADVWRHEAPEPVLLLKPRTYMNESGRAVRDVLGYFRIDPAGVLVIHDDLDLPVGRIRFRREGSSGGHRGVASVIECLGDAAFARLKLGIGHPQEGDAVAYVLSLPPPDEREALAEAEGRASAAAEDWIRWGLDWCMNAYNRAEAPGA